MQKNHSPVTELKNFAFLVPHLPEFEGELQDLLIEIDKLIERKRTEWETELKNLERKLQLKVRENQELQTLISTKESELKEAASRLRLMEHNFPGGSPEEELNAIKSKVDKMRRGYEILQKKYHKQLGTEKEQSSRALCQLEQTNSLLKQELEDLREESQEQVNSWKTLLEEEKSKSEETDKYCQRLQAELKDLNNRIDQERLDNHNLKEIYHSRCQELEAELEQAKRLSQDQVTEMYEAKRKTGEKTKELARLTSELQTAQTDLTLTGNAVHHLEFLVLQHIALVSKSVKQGVDIDFPCRNPITRSSTMSRSELETKIKDIERKIQKCDHEVLEKFSEMRRLESACQTASGTIHRLVEARTQSMRQVASLSAVLNKAVHGMHLLVERVDSVKYLLSEKLSVTRNGISRVQHAFDKLQSVQSLKKVTRAVLDSGVQTLSSEVEVAVQTAPNAQSPSFDLERVQNDWSTQTKQLHSVIMKLTEDRSQLQSRLHHQLGLVERLQKENLALSDLLTNAEQFNRTRITCQNPLLRESRSNRTRNVEVQVDPWPACAPTQSISPFGMRRSLPSPNKPCIASRARLMESTAFTDSQISPVRFHPLSPASEQTDTIGAVECGQPKPSPDTNQTLISSVVLDRPSVEFPTQFEIPINQAPKVLGLNNRPHARGDSMDSISPINSPSEYEDFALPGFRDPNAIKSSPTHSHNGLCTRALDSPVVAQPVGIRRSRSVHVRFPVPATTVYKIDGNSNKLSSNIYPKEKPLYQISTESYDAGDEVALLAPGDPTLPQACSTLRPTPNATKPLCVYTDYENADTNDSSVYDLAAKFLADEKKFSSRLEQKIDAHLEVLKNQFRLDS